MQCDISGAFRDIQLYNTDFAVSAEARAIQFIDTTTNKITYAPDQTICLTLNWTNTTPLELLMWIQSYLAESSPRHSILYSNGTVILK
jgi:hypothetical protein